MKACTTLKNSVQNSQTNTQGCNKQDSQNVAHKTVKERQYKEDKVWEARANFQIYFSKSFYKIRCLKTLY